MSFGSISWVGSNTFAWQTLRGSSKTWTNGFDTDSELSSSSNGDAAPPYFANSALGDYPNAAPQRWHPTAAAGGETRHCSSTRRFRTATSTNWESPGWPHNL